MQLPGQGEAAPARLLEQRSTKDHHKGEGPEVSERGRKGRDIERRQGDRSEESAERHDRREAQEDEQVLPQAESPSHYPTQQATYARPPFGRARHDEGGHGRPQQAGGGLVALRARYGRAAYRRTHVSPTYCGVPERTIGEVSNNHQRFACVLLSVVFMRLNQARNQGLVGLTEVTLVGRASSVPLEFGLANAAYFANANFSAYSRNNGLRQGF
jgi:hypothetical protein